MSRVARVVAPKKAALKEAEAELAVAMEVRDFFIIFGDLQLCWAWGQTIASFHYAHSTSPCTDVEELSNEPRPHSRGVATLYRYVTLISADKLASIF